MKHLTNLFCSPLSNNSGKKGDIFHRVSHRMCPKISGIMRPCSSGNGIWDALSKREERSNLLNTRTLITLVNNYVVGIQRDFHSISENSHTPFDHVAFISQVQHRDNYGHNGCFSKPYLLNKLISSCAKSASLGSGIQLHSMIVKLGFTSNLYICSALLDMYGKCYEIASASNLFDEMPERNEVSWNSLISGYLNVERPELAVELFIKMLRMEVVPSPFSFSACLIGCVQSKAIVLGVQVHGLILKGGFSYDVVVGTALIDMYCKCCNIEHARNVFDSLVDRNVVTWTCMVTGYANNGQPNMAMFLVRKMLLLGIRMNCVTYNSLLTSFTSLSCFDCCKQVHCRLIHEGFDSNMYIEVTLLTVYSKCSASLDDFLKISSGITKWEQISWNAFISGYCNLGYDEESFKFFSQMRQSRVCVDVFSFTSILGSIGNIAALNEGKQTHGLVLKTGYTSNINVQNALVSMYARSGAIRDAKKVFFLMKDHDVISWNSLLSGCAHNGYGKETVNLFEEMKKTDVKPNGTTFLAVLSACSHAGFVEKGLEYFYLMEKDSVEAPRLEHYTTVVSLLGRAGYVDRAEAFVNSMPLEPGLSVHKALLSACHVYEEKEIATRSAKRILELWPDDPAAYVMLSNLLTTWGSWDAAAEVRKLMCERGVRKKPGSSLI